MRSTEFTQARDYNRGLPAPIRVIHLVWAFALWATYDIRVWAKAPGRRAWAIPALWGLLGFVVLYPLDGAISRFFATHKMGGDLRRELEAAQQYGQLLSSLLIALIIWLQDPARRRQLADWAAAFAVAGVTCWLLKALVGRPRPKFGDPAYFLGPFGEYPIDSKVGVRHAWEFWSGISSDLWSMPSSHTVYACIMAVAVGRMYPRLAPLVAIIAGIVGFGRIATVAHYPTDVALGAALGAAIARLSMTRRWGQTLLTRRAASPPSPASRG